MKKNILLIDDDSKLNALLTDYLSRFEFTVHAVTHPQLGLDYIAKQMPDLIILDVMLPEMDGFEACRRIRQKFSTPIIMLTARGEVTDRIVGLEIGADDYIPKPFEPRELVARIQTVTPKGSLNLYRWFRLDGVTKDGDKQPPRGPLPAVYREKLEQVVRGRKTRGEPTGRFPREWGTG